MKKIIWCVEHKPVELLIRVAQDFKKILSTYTDEFDIEILTSQEFADFYNSGNYIPTEELVLQNKVQISQTFSWRLRQFNPSFLALELPYMFRDHDHAKKVLDGEIGQNLLDNLNNKDSGKSLKGLAFTYSGGYRLFCSSEPVHGIEDLKGRHLMVVNNPIAIDIAESFGAIPDPGDHWYQRHQWYSGKGSILETTWVRYLDFAYAYAPYVIDTKHSLFLTTLICNIDFWNSLSQEHQEIFSKAAQEAAHNEKQNSISAGRAAIDEMKKTANAVIELQDEELKIAKEMTQPVFDKWQKSIFQPALIERIVST